MNHTLQDSADHICPLGSEWDWTIDEGPTYLVEGGETANLERHPLYDGIYNNNICFW